MAMPATALETLALETMALETMAQQPRPPSSLTSLTSTISTPLIFPTPQILPTLTRTRFTAPSSAPPLTRILLSLLHQTALRSRLNASR
jgi:hypothetical protein